MANIRYLLGLYNRDKEILINLINKHYPSAKLVFDNFGRAGSNGAIQILEDGSSGEIYLRNFNASKYIIPDGNLSVQIFNLTKHLEGFERVEAQIQILKDLGVAITDDDDGDDDGDGKQSHPAKPIHPTQIHPAKLRINQQKSVNSNIILEYENFTTTDDDGGVILTTLGKSVLDYFDKKCGVNHSSGDAIFDCFGIRPLKSKTIITKGKKFVFKYTPKDFAFTYQSGDALKIKQPNQKKFKNLWVQNVHDYVFGFDAIIGDGDICLICGGEDDAICINTHFCDATPSVVAVAVGSETKPINPLLVRRLQRDFETVAICFDFDDVGIFNAQKNAMELNIPYLNFCNPLSMMGYEPYTMKDVCDVWQHVAIEKQSYNDFLNIIKYTVQDSI